NAGIPYQARLEGTRRIRLAKTRIAKDGARVRSLSKKESKKRSTIRCSKQPAQPRRRTKANREFYRRVLNVVAVDFGRFLYAITHIDCGYIDALFPKCE